MQTSKGKGCGGYTKVSWKPRTKGEFQEDSDAFIFSLDTLTKFKPSDPRMAVRHSIEYGPTFGYCSLALWDDPMNDENSGWCFTNGSGHSWGRDNYNIPNDSEGNSVLTGDGSGIADCDKKFTCVELEVYGITF